MNQISHSAAYFSQAIDASGLTQREIAHKAGLRNPNVISMWKKGDGKIPLDRVPALARACNKAPKEFLEITMREYQPEIWEVLKETYGIGAGIVKPAGLEE